MLERTADLDVNTLDKRTGEAPLHAIVKKNRKDRVNLVMILLINSNADIHLATSRAATPLHLAVEVKPCSITLLRREVVYVKNCKMF